MMATEMSFSPFFPDKDKRAYWIAGPCSAETEAQVLETARGLAKSHIDLFRAGIWKPRTRPNSFEGIGSVGLQWLKTVKEETGLKTCTEVANTQHVEECLKAGIDVLWIGARTTVSPFAVQEIADALRGVDIQVLVKNPINPDIKLWIGAIERIFHSGISGLGAIHRGFSAYSADKYRNQPRWQLAIELKRQFPHLMMICDSSHICGNREMLEDVAQTALDLNYDGIMMEVHPDPDHAWSDAAQQITPKAYSAIKNRLKYRMASSDDEAFLESLDHFRHQIDEIDEEIMSLMANRMKLAESIGAYKKKKNISILQTKRWGDILEKSIEKGSRIGLSEEFVSSLLKAVHQESINHQHRLMSDGEL